MPRAKDVKPLTDDEKYQQAQQAEVLLGRLRKEYTIWELIKNQSESRNPKLSQSDRVLQIFQKEHQNILTSLQVANSPSKRNDDDKACRKIGKLISEYDYFDHEMLKQKTYQKEIKDQICIVKKNVHVLQKQQITDRQHEDRVWKARKTMEALENRLDMQVKKFCAIVSKTMNMRTEIDRHLSDRKNFLTVWDKIIGKMVRGKKILIDIIEQATIAYDQSESWRTKLTAVRFKSQQDLQHRLHEMRQLHRVNDDHKKLEEFLTVKYQKRLLLDLHRQHCEQRDATRRKLQEKLDDYGRMVNEIQEFCSETRLDRISKNVRNQEVENFMYFTYIINLIKEMETVNEELLELHLRIDAKKILSEKRTMQQADRLQSLETTLETKSKETKEKQNRSSSVDATFKELTKGIWSLFKICKCENDTLLALLGENSRINQFNVLLYMEILEGNVNNLLVRACYQDKNTGQQYGKKILATLAKPHDMYDIRELVDTNPCPLCIEHELINEAIEYRQKVLTRQAAKKQLKERLKEPDAGSKLHNVSKCHMPRAREIMQSRYAL